MAFPGLLSFGTLDFLLGVQQTMHWAKVIPTARRRGGARKRWYSSAPVHTGDRDRPRQWGAPMERMSVPPAREGSWEAMLHHTGEENRLLVFSDPGAEELPERRDHRAIGVVYATFESYGNYVPSVLPRRYDAFLYVDKTRALRPLHAP